MASPADERFAPFTVPQSLPETDVAVRLFANFRELLALSEIEDGGDDAIADSA